MNSHLDDLPQRPEEHIMSDESTKKLYEIIKDPYFIMREEKKNDYGVDITVELVILPSNPSNIRFHIQLKSTDKDVNKRDGSISVPVARTNLNYLLNSPKSFYVLYHRPSDTFYYKSAEVVFKECEESGEKWHSQESITVRFMNKLDMNSRKEIYDEVRNYHKWSKAARLTVNKFAASLSSRVVFDPRKWSIVDIDKLVDDLSKYGIEIVNRGYAKDVLNLIARIPAEDLDNGNILLTAAYANYFLDRYYATYNMLVQIKPFYSQLDRNSQEFIQMLELSCKLGLGLIDNKTYFEEAVKLTASFSSESMKYHSRLEELRYRAMRQEKDVLNDINALVRELAEKSEQYEPLKIQAELTYLEAESYFLTSACRREVFGYRMLQDLGLERRLFHKRMERVNKLRESYRVWLNRFERLRTRVIDHGSPILIGDFYYTFVSVTIQRDWINFQIIPGYKECPEFSKYIDGLKEKLNTAKKIFKENGLELHYLQALLVEVDILCFSGDVNTARAVAERIVKEAEFYGYTNIRNEAERIKNGGSPFPVITEKASWMATE